jgi:hypothetical protein
MKIKVSRYEINVNNINYLVHESDKLLHIFFIGQDVPLILHNDEVSEFLSLYNEI